MAGYSGIAIGEREDEADPEDVTGNRGPQNRDELQDAVQPATVQGRGDAEHDADDRREDHREDDQRQGDGDAGGEGGRHLLAGQERCAEIAADESGEPVEVLDDEGLIEPQLHCLRRHLLIARIETEDGSRDPDAVAVGDAEGEEGHQEQHGDGSEDENDCCTQHCWGPIAGYFWKSRSSGCSAEKSDMVGMEMSGL